MMFAAQEQALRTNAIKQAWECISDFAAEKYLILLCVAQGPKWWQNFTISRSKTHKIWSQILFFNRSYNLKHISKQKILPMKLTETN